MQHRFGKNGAKYTKRFKPVAIAMVWQVAVSKGDAMRIEYQIKQLSKVQKELLIQQPQSLSQIIEFDLGGDCLVQYCDHKELSDIWQSITASI